MLYDMDVGYPRHPCLRHVSVFPTKGPMPLASSTDLILAGIHDIVHALHNPSPGSLLAPLSDSLFDALTQLTSILTSVAAPTTNPSPTRGVIPTTPAIPDEPLRVPQPPTVPMPLALVPDDTKTVTFGPLPVPPVRDTFTNSTGAIGTRRRRARRLHAPAKSLQDSRTVHPNKRKAVPNVVPLPPPRHLHGTRSQGPPRLQHVAALALANILADAHKTRDTTMPHHFALHGNAFNPDTGQIAEYRELSKCSDGVLWQASNADEIGRLAQGYGTIKGTNTMFFIRVSDIPRGRKATYLRVVSAFRPEKENPRRVRWTCGGDKVDNPFDVSTVQSPPPHTQRPCLC